MRRTLIITAAGWLAGVAGALAQVPIPSPRGPDVAPPAAIQDRGPIVTPYTPGPRGPAVPDAARRTMYRPNGRLVSNSQMAADGNGVYMDPPGPAAPVNGNPLMGYPTANGPMMFDCAGCGDCGDCCGCPPCGPPGRFWLSAEYLLWWTTPMNVPPLVTGAPPGTPRELAGRLDQATTTILFGGAPVFADVRSGLRTRAGMWIDECHMLGVEGSFFFLQPQRFNYLTDCPIGNAIITRPFIDVNPAVNRQNTELVALPGVLFGCLTVDGRTDLYGADVNFRRALCCDCNYRIDVLAGYRFLSLNDRLNVTECLVSLVPGTVGSVIQVQDRFATDNRFHGGQIGVAAEISGGRLFLDFRALVALGGTSQTVNIAGSTTFTVPNGATTVNPGGLLAQPTNIGTFTRTEFGVVPEVGLNVGLNLSERMRVFFGYSFLYWSSVVRAGDQIDLTVNSTQLPFNGAPGALVGPARPRFIFNTSGYWTHGISFGAQLRF